VKLIPVDSSNEQHVQVLWDLLAQRQPWQNISHSEMPTPAQHCRFVANHPYEAWYLIEAAVHDPGAGTLWAGIVGAIYLSKPGGPSVPGNEIGIDILAPFWGFGLGKKAISLLMEFHGPRRYIANVAPGNEASQALFKSLGFKLCQHTYSLEAA
jgi:RimJ/RimL family protein N-acetyltransferase